MPEWFGLAASLVIGLLFLSSGLAKWRRGDTLSSVENYGILPPFLAHQLAQTLPWVETMAGMLVILQPRVGLPACGGLLLVFSVGVLLNLIRGKHFDCGCRSEQRPISWALLAENVALCGISVASMTSTPSSPLAPLLGQASAPPVGTLVASSIVAVSLFVIYALVRSAGTTKRLLGGT